MWQVAAEDMWQVVAEDMWQVDANDMWQALAEDIWQLLAEEMWQVVAEDMWQVVVEECDGGIETKACPSILLWFRALQFLAISGNSNNVPVHVFGHRMRTGKDNS